MDPQRNDEVLLIPYRIQAPFQIKTYSEVQKSFLPHGQAYPYPQDHPMQKPPPEDIEKFQEHRGNYKRVQIDPESVEGGVEVVHKDRKGCPHQLVSLKVGMLPSPTVQETHKNINIGRVHPVLSALILSYI